LARLEKSVRCRIAGKATCGGTGTMGGNRLEHTTITN